MKIRCAFPPRIHSFSLPRLLRERVRGPYISQRGRRAEERNSARGLLELTAVSERLYSKRLLPRDPVASDSWSGRDGNDAAYKPKSEDCEKLTDETKSFSDRGHVYWISPSLRDRYLTALIPLESALRSSIYFAAVLIRL